MSTNQLTEGASTERAVADVTRRREALENDRVLVVESTYAPDGRLHMHAHRFPHVTYVIDGGTVETTDPDGETETLEVRSGQTFWRAAQSHSSRNVGPSPVRIVEVEVKDPFRQTHGENGPRAASPADLEWRPDPLDSTRKIALLAGDPTEPGPYSVRMRAEGGYSLGLHEHPTEDEHLTVLSGTLYWSNGEAGSGAPEHALPAGSFLFTPAGTPHRIWTTEPLVLQLTGVGPRSYHYFDPEDDPRTGR